MSLNRLAIVAAAAVFVLGLGVASAYQARTRDQSPAPEAVQKTVEKYFGHTGSYRIEPKYLDGVRCYVVTASKNGNPVTITLSKAGDLQETMTPITFGKLPKPVQDRLRDDYPTGAFKHVRSVELRLFEVSVPGQPEKLVRIFAAGNHLMGNPPIEEPEEESERYPDWQDEHPDDDDDDGDHDG